MLTTLTEAVQRIPDGSSVYIGNFGAQLFEVGHALVDARKRDLHVIAPSGGILVDQLIGEGVTRRLTLTHCWNPIGPAATINFRRAVEEGMLELTELSFGAFHHALLAAAWGMPFLPTSDLAGTGYVTKGRANGALIRVDSKLGPILAVRALRPDYAFIHVDTCTEDGSAWLRHPLADSLAAAQASRLTVVVSEQLEDNSERGKVPADIAAPFVHDVVVGPGAVFPDGAAGRYGRATDLYQLYATASRERDGLAVWREAVRQRWSSHG